MYTPVNRSLKGGFKRGRCGGVWGGGPNYVGMFSDVPYIRVELTQYSEHFSSP